AAEASRAVSHVAPPHHHRLARRLAGGGTPRQSLGHDAALDRAGHYRHGDVFHRLRRPVYRLRRRGRLAVADLAQHADHAAGTTVRVVEQTRLTAYVVHAAVRPDHAKIQRVFAHPEALDDCLSRLAAVLRVDAFEDCLESRWDVLRQ